MTPEQKIEAEAEEKFPILDKDWMMINFPYADHDRHIETVNNMREAYIAGRSAGLEREKELEDGLKYNAYAIWKGISSNQSFEEWNIEFLKRFNLNK